MRSGSRLFGEHYEYMVSDVDQLLFRRTNSRALPRDNLDFPRHVSSLAVYQRIDEMRTNPGSHPSLLGSTSNCSTTYHTHCFSSGAASLPNSIKQHWALSGLQLGKGKYQESDIFHEIEFFKLYLRKGR